MVGYRKDLYPRELLNTYSVMNEIIPNAINTNVNGVMYAFQYCTTSGVFAHVEIAFHFIVISLERSICFSSVNPFADAWNVSNNSCFVFSSKSCMYFLCIFFFFHLNLLCPKRQPFSLLFGSCYSSWIDRRKLKRAFENR